MQKARAQTLRRDAAKPATADKTRPAPATPAPAKRRKLGYKDQRELDALPALIEALEAEQRALAEQLSGAEIYSGGATRLAEAQARAGRIEEELMAALERWEALGAA